MTQLFGTPRRARAEVRNGNGQPGVGESVGAQLIPAGFRIVLCDNADTFDHQTTEIIADGTENEPRRRQTPSDALGVGKVIVSQVSSGLGRRLRDGRPGLSRMTDDTTIPRAIALAAAEAARDKQATDVVVLDVAELLRSPTTS